MSDTQDQLKQKAAYHAVDEFIESGMVVGLGVGSTAIHGVRRLAEHLQSGRLRDIVAIPAAYRVKKEAEKLGIPLTNLSQNPRIDVTFDGADEVDAKLNLIKGGGGALLREKMLAQASAKEIILVDESKLSTHLGEKWALPIEVLEFGLGAQAAFLKDLGGEPALRGDENGEAYLTDNGFYILDTHFGPIHDPASLAAKLEGRAGIIEHGLFVGLATAVIVASATNDDVQVLWPT